MNRLRIALAQINPTVGDLKGNTEKCVQYIKRAKACKTDIIIFPEYTISGYPPFDLLLNPDFIKDSMASLKRLVPHTKNIMVIVGCIDVKEGGIYNAGAIIVNGKLFHVYHKIHLEKSRIFDETLYFKQGTHRTIYSINGVNLTFTMGNEIMEPLPSDSQLIVNLHTNPYYIESHTLKEKAIVKKTKDSMAYCAYVNMAGAQDGIVFHGKSLIINEKGHTVAMGAAFEEDLVVTDIEFNNNKKKSPSTETMKIPFTVKNKTDTLTPGTPKKTDPLNEIYSALVTGAKDYARKNGFQKIVLGLSGGIDSSLVAAIVRDALGSKNVVGIFMPSQYTSKESREDVYGLAKNLHLHIIEVPIDNIFHVYMDILKHHFKNKDTGITWENLQPRIRANILMAFSNTFGWLVVTTGNKSEFATGYSTLYGDTAGGFAVLSDVSKSLVYKLASWKNKQAGFSLIPDRILTKVPSAELKPHQKDTDTLPPYHILDPILEAYIENNKSMEEIRTMGFERAVIKKITYMVDSNEYKRRQSPAGIKITKRAFLRDRIFPITNRFRPNIS